MVLLFFLYRRSLADRAHSPLRAERAPTVARSNDASACRHMSPSMASVGEVRLK